MREYRNRFYGIKHNDIETEEDLGKDGTSIWKG
jgi:hypothetical protein